TAARALAGHPTPAVRLALVSGHYRATVEYNATAMAEAETVWERFRATAVRAARRLGEHPSTALDAPLGEGELPAAFTAALNALLAGRDAADPAEIADSLGRLRAMLDVLGLDPLGAQWARPDGTGGGEREALDALITAQLAAREAARAEKDWARADALRDALSAAGIGIEG